MSNMNANQPPQGRGPAPPAGDRNTGPRGAGGGLRPTRSDQGARPDRPSRPDRPTGAYGQRESQPPRRVAELWPDYLKDGYFDAQGNLKPQYISRRMVEPLVRAMAGDPERALTAGQVRRFFQHCRGIAARLKTRQADWSQVLPDVLLMDAAAQEAYGRKPDRRIPALFLDFIRENIAAVKSEKDFVHGFMRHFEALVGFGAMHLPSEGSGYHEESRSSYHSRHHRTEKRDADRRQ